MLEYAVVQSGQSITAHFRLYLQAYEWLFEEMLSKTDAQLLEIDKDGL